MTTSEEDIVNYFYEQGKVVEELLDFLKVDPDFLEEMLASEPKELSDD